MDDPRQQNGIVFCGDLSFLNIDFHLKIRLITLVFMLLFDYLSVNKQIYSQSKSSRFGEQNKVVTELHYSLGKLLSAFSPRIKSKGKRVLK